MRGQGQASLSKQIDSMQFQTLHRDVHSLCGSAGTYGYPELGKTAKQLDIILKSLFGNDLIPQDTQEKITSYIAQLKTTLTCETQKNVPVLETKTSTPSGKKC